MDQLQIEGEREREREREIITKCLLLCQFASSLYKTLVMHPLLVNALRFI